MQQAPFICRSCLFRSWEAWRRQLPTWVAQRKAYATAQIGVRDAGTEDPFARLSEGHLRPQRTPSNVLRKPSAGRPLRSYAPRGADEVPDSTRRIDIPSSVIPPSERQFDASNYSPEDQEFWKRYEELWGDGEELHQLIRAESGLESESDGKQQQRLGLRPDPRREQKSKPSPAPPLQKKASRTSGSKKGKFATTEIMPKEKERELVVELLYLKRRCDPEQFPKEKAKFWRWKNSLGETRPMIARPRLPQAPAKVPGLKHLLQHGDVDTMRTAWEKLPLVKRQRTWPDVMLAALRWHPDKAHTVFEATFDASLVHSYLAQDTITYLARQHLQLRSDAYKVPPKELFRLVKMVLQRSPKGYLRVRQSTLYFLIRILETEDLAEFYQLLLDYEHPLHKMTRLQIASRMAKDTRYKELAVDVLQLALSETDLDINSVQATALCTLVLTASEEHTAANPRGATPAEMFSRLLSCGLEPNVITYTTIIRGLCLRGELDAAHQVFQVMVENETEPDAHVYSAILNGSKLWGRTDMVADVVKMAAAADVREAVVWNDFLQATHLSALSESRKKTTGMPRVVPAFSLMLQAYSKTFALGPLKALFPDIADLARRADEHLGFMEGWEFFAQLSPVVRDLPQRAGDELIAPDSVTLTSMILGYLQNLSNPYDIIGFYSRFRKLLRAGDEAAVRLVREKGTLVHDMVIMRLCEYNGMLRVALEVVGDMLKDTLAAAAAAADKSEPGGRHRHHHPPPSVYTWSVLLHGFMLHRQVAQGEKILRMMRDRGVEPNLVTWNTLIGGYARAQNVKSTARSIQRLEAAGFEVDEYSFKAIRALGNKRALLSYMEAGQQRRATTTTAKGKGKGKGKEKGAAASEGGAGMGLGLDRDEGDLRTLASEVEEIAKMMDEEREDSEGGVTPA